LKEEKMGVVIGIVVGYALGSRAGAEAWPELEEAWKTIISSEEVRDLVSGGVSIATDIFARRGEFLAGLLGVADPDAKLRRVA
jgi:hypothetical protein